MEEKNRGEWKHKKGRMVRGGNESKRDELRNYSFPDQTKKEIENVACNFLHPMSFSIQALSRCCSWAFLNLFECGAPLIGLEASFHNFSELTGTQFQKQICTL